MASRGPRIAVMQPYFFPYAGYFRLLAAADYFVMLDCVQFNRRGRVHRVQVPGPAGNAEWLTLPLQYHPQDVRIRDLAFASGARHLLDERLRRHPWIHTGAGPLAGTLRRHLHGPLGSVADFLEAGIRLTAAALDLPATIMRSSQLGVAPGLRGQERIMAIVQALQGTEYINAPGGRLLYDSAMFAKAGITLSFLVPYDGCYPYLLPALFGIAPAAIRADIDRTARTAAAEAPGRFPYQN